MPRTAPGFPVQKPAAVLLLHAPCTDVVTWENFSFMLGACGYLVRCPQMPTSHSEKDVSDQGVAEDREVVRKHLRDLISKGNRIVVLAHSQAGVVASDSITPEFYYSPETNVGVVHILFVCAYLPHPGFSAGDIFNANPSGTKTSFKVVDGIVRTVNPAGAFCNDLPIEQARNIVRENISASQKAFFDSVSHVPWKDIPCSYVYTNKDKAILLWLQKDMVARATEAGGKFIEHSINSGHVPHVSKPNDLFAILRPLLDT